MLSFLGIFQVDGHVGGTSFVDGYDGKRERNSAVKHDDYEVVGLHTALYEPLRQDVRTARQLAVGQAVRGVGYGKAVWMLAGTLFEGLHKGHLRVDVQLLASPQFDERKTLVGTNDVKFPERLLRVSHHVVDGTPHGLGYHPQRVGIVHGQTRFHTYLVIVIFQVDIHTEVGVGLLSHRLNGTNFDAIYHHVLLHIGHPLKIERHARFHLKVGTEVGKGIGTVADGTHQLCTLAPDKVNHPLRGIGIGQHGHRLDKHAHTATQPLVHTSVVDARIGDLLLAGEHRHDVAKGSLEKQVGLNAVLMAPVVALMTV